MTQTPSVGRVVHYLSYGSPVRPDGTQKFKSECRAAIVTAAGDEEVISLCVLNPTGFFFNEDCDHDESSDRVGGTWHWPERV